jgi:hypothetical protein
MDKKLNLKPIYFDDAVPKHIATTSSPSDLNPTVSGVLMISSKLNYNPFRSFLPLAPSGETLIQLSQPRPTQALATSPTTKPCPAKRNWQERSFTASPFDMGVA